MVIIRAKATVLWIRQDQNLGAVLAIFTAAASAALFGNAEQSERGFRLLNWLDNRRGESELPPAESNR
ncbi:hypothetical protein ADK56_21265 [Streptomyces sp. MMG1522]|nr:hypothetical protein ADK56_21265 [Streptomyces sp. MMG1522]